jgi:hypothetical protein
LRNAISGGGFSFKKANMIIRHLMSIYAGVVDNEKSGANQDTVMGVNSVTGSIGL